MHRHIEDELQALKQKLLLMGGLVEKALDATLTALQNRNPAGFESVFESEEKIDLLQMQIDEACVDVIARQQPLAADLRLVIAILKISTDLERMGDQAVNISHYSKDYLKYPPLTTVTNLAEMASIAKMMVRDSLDSFVKRDRELAEMVLERDDEVDRLKREMIEEMKIQIQKTPSNVAPALDLIFIARNLERLGDHATNIAEDVVFAVTGMDIRHKLKTGHTAGS